MNDFAEFGKMIEFAKYVDIEDLAMRYGYTFRTSGKHRICNNKEGLVLYPATNSFKNFYENVGGTTIDFVMNEEQVSFKEAVSIILDNAVVPDFNIKRENKRIVNEDKILDLPKKNENHKRVFAYLSQTRYISKDIISKMLKDHMIYESADKHNCIFLAYDLNGTAKHGYVRGTNSYVQYRGDVSGSDKKYGFCVRGTTDTLRVFEAPIDLLSYMTLKPDCKDTLVALGMLSDEPIYTALAENEKINKVSIIVDYDGPGVAAKARMEEKLQVNGYEIIDDDVYEMMKKTGNKDVNELLCSIKEPSMDIAGISR